MEGLRASKVTMTESDQIETRLRKPSKAWGANRTPARRDLPGWAISWKNKTSSLLPKRDVPGRMRRSILHPWCLSLGLLQSRIGIDSRVPSRCATKWVRVIYAVRVEDFLDEDEEGRVVRHIIGWECR